MEEESRRKREEARGERDREEKKPVSEKVKEMVGAR